MMDNKDGPTVDETAKKTYDLASTAQPGAVPQSIKPASAVASQPTPVASPPPGVSTSLIATSNVVPNVVVGIVPPPGVSGGAISSSSPPSSSAQKLEVPSESKDDAPLYALTNPFSSVTLTHLVLPQPSPNLYQGFRVARFVYGLPQKVEKWSCPYYNRGLIHSLETDKYMNGLLSLDMRRLVIPINVGFQVQSGEEYDMRGVSSLSLSSAGKLVTSSALSEQYPRFDDVEGYVEPELSADLAQDHLIKCIFFSDPEARVAFCNRAKLTALRPRSTEIPRLLWPGVTGVKQYYFSDRRYMESFLAAAYFWELRLFALDATPLAQVFVDQGVTGISKAIRTEGEGPYGAVHRRHLAPRLLSAPFVGMMPYWRFEVSPLVVEPYIPLSFTAGDIICVPNKTNDGAINTMNSIFTQDASGGSEFFKELSTYLLTGSATSLRMIQVQRVQPSTAMLTILLGIFLPPVGCSLVSRRIVVEDLRVALSIPTITPMADILGAQMPVRWGQRIELWRALHAAYTMPWTRVRVRRPVDNYFGPQVWYVPEIIANAWQLQTGNVFGIAGEEVYYVDQNIAVDIARLLGPVMRAFDAFWKKSAIGNRKQVYVGEFMGWRFCAAWLHFHLRCVQECTSRWWTRMAIEDTLILSNVSLSSLPTCPIVAPPIDFLKMLVVGGVSPSTPPVMPVLMPHVLYNSLFKFDMQERFLRTCVYVARRSPLTLANETLFLYSVLAFFRLLVGTAIKAPVFTPGGMMFDHTQVKPFNFCEWNGGDDLMLKSDMGFLVEAVRKVRNWIVRQGIAAFGHISAAFIEDRLNDEPFYIDERSRFVRCTSMAYRWSDIDVLTIMRPDPVKLTRRVPPRAMLRMFPNKDLKLHLDDFFLMPQVWDRESVVPDAAVDVIIPIRLSLSLAPITFVSDRELTRKEDIPVDFYWDQKAMPTLKDGEYKVSSFISTSYLPNVRGRMIPCNVAGEPVLPFVDVDFDLLTRSLTFHQPFCPSSFVSEIGIMLRGFNTEIAAVIPIFPEYESNFGARIALQP